MLRGIEREFLRKSEKMEAGSWQGIKGSRVMYEQLNFNLYIPLFSKDEAANALKPRKEWADKHFEERVSGKPSNPDPSSEEWSSESKKWLNKEGKFSHTYSERMWPSGLCSGIRFKVGDLSYIPEILNKDKTSRQAFMPMFMYEDLTASLLGERVPCSLGWHFIIRGDKLHLNYIMRSVDLYRHLMNDLYLANRLALWVISQLKYKVELGYMYFFATSLHCFEEDLKMKGLK